MIEISTKFWIDFESIQDNELRRQLDSNKEIRSSSRMKNLKIVSKPFPLRFETGNCCSIDEILSLSEKISARLCACNVDKKQHMQLITRFFKKNPFFQTLEARMK